jgi:anti-anti-sigma factor
LKINITSNDRYVLAKISGRIDIKTYGELEKKLELSIENSKFLFLDMEDVEYISSVGVRVLITIFKKGSKANCELVLVNSKGMVKEIIDLTGLSSILRSCDSLSDAIRNSEF